LNDPNVAILVVNSNVKHELEGTEYSERRETCQKVAKILGKASLRDAALEDLESMMTFIIMADLGRFIDNETNKHSRKLRKLERRSISASSGN
jgi:galactokinase